MRLSISRSTFASTAAAFASIAILPRGVRAAGATWKLGHDLDPAHPTHKRLIEFADTVKTATNGELVITVFPANQLGGDTQMLTQMRANAIQLYFAPGAIIGSVAPGTALPDMAFAFKDNAMVWSAMDGDVGAQCRLALEKVNIVSVPGVWNNGFSQVFNNVRPINTPGDLVGLKIRTSASQLWVTVFKGFGATPTPINLSEAYAALQTKLVDGVNEPLSTFEYDKFYEVQKYASLLNTAWGGYWMVSNPESWNSLTTSVQDKVRRINYEVALKQRADIEHIDEILPTRLTQQGMTVNKPSDPVDSFRKKLREAGYYANWRATLGDVAWHALEKYTGPIG